MPQGEVDRKDRRSGGYDNGLGQGDKEQNGIGIGIRL